MEIYLVYIHKINWEDTSAPELLGIYKNYSDALQCATTKLQLIYKNRFVFPCIREMDNKQLCDLLANELYIYPNDKVGYPDDDDQCKIYIRKNIVQSNFNN